MRKNTQQELDDLNEQLDMAKHENALLRHKIKSMSISNDQGTSKTVSWDLSSIYPWATGLGSAGEHEARTDYEEESWCGSHDEPISDTHEGSESPPAPAANPERQGYITRDKPGTDKSTASARDTEGEDTE